MPGRGAIRPGATDKERAKAMPNPPVLPDPPAVPDSVDSTVMKFRGAYLEERGVHFAVISVEPETVQSESAQKEAVKTYQRFFPEASIVLMVENENQPPTYYGRRDIVAFLNTLEETQIKWKMFTLQQTPSSPAD
jgi:hypothetical protein